MTEAMNTQFSIPGALSVVAGKNDLPKVVLTHASGSSAEVYLHGAHVTSWKNSQGKELFFISRESHFAYDKPFRGGIPVIFPQFGGGVLPPHGLARISDWELAQTQVREDGAVIAVLRLADSPALLAQWPHPFALIFAVILQQDKLTVTFRVNNTGDQTFAYNAVLHTYFRVADIDKTALYDLQGVTFIDSLRDNIRDVETRPVMRFAEETDRIYVDAPDSLHLEDEGNGRTMTITKCCMPDVVVWNPWIAKSQRMPDFGDDEYQWMVCVETGNMAEQRELAAGAEWYGETTFTAS